MTNLDALRAELDPFTLSNDKMELKLLKSGVDPNVDFLLKNSKEISKAACSLLVDCKQMSSISEGGYSITYDSKAVDDKIISICKEAGIDASEFLKVPTVRRASQYW